MMTQPNDDTLLQGSWTWEDMRTARRNELTDDQMEQLIEDLCRHLAI